MTGMPLVRLNTSRKRFQALLTPASSTGAGRDPAVSHSERHRAAIVRVAVREVVGEGDEFARPRKVWVHPAPIGKAAEVRLAPELAHELAAGPRPGTRGANSRASKMKLR